LHEVRETGFLLGEFLSEALCFFGRSESLLLLIRFGVNFRRNFFLLFATEDMREGMQAFIDKRKAEFQGR